MGKTKTASRKANVISISMDANFFFERAIRSLDRLRYEKALKYFRRASELEPDNPANHCNMAGILSEMGDYEQSNAILSKILEDIDPMMTECYFYMANNYANMEDFEAAETALAQYLERDPEGHFSEEAEEMLDLIGYELNRPVRHVASGKREEWLEHDRARLLLENGHFAEAAKVLENIVRKRPDLVAARNNLALAYYYMGEYDRSLGQIRKVLRQDPGNLHARCNLAIFCRQFGYEDELKVLVAGLKKLAPYHPEHAFKVATTLGMLEEHDAAYAQFRRLLKEGDGAGEPSFYHYAAVAAYRSGRQTDAFRLWNKAAKLDGPGSVAAFCLDTWGRRDAAGGERAESGEPGVAGGAETGGDGEAGGGSEGAPSYYYLMPFEEQLRLAEQPDGPLAEAVSAEPDPLVAASIIWTLEHGEGERKKAAIQAAERFGGLADPSVRGALEELLNRPDEKPDVRRLVRRVLEGFGGRKAGLPRWDAKWQAVLETALARMGNRYNLIQRHDLQTLWVEFLSRVYPDVPKVTKAEGWAAALEYLTAKMHRVDITFKELSGRYGVSPQTVGRHAREIDRVCGLREKMQNLYRLDPDPFR